MRVVLRNGDVEVELSEESSYLSSIMRNLCDNAVRVYDQAFDDDVEQDSSKDAEQ